MARMDLVAQIVQRCPHHALADMHIFRVHPGSGKGAEPLDKR